MQNKILFLTFAAVAIIVGGLVVGCGGPKEQVGAQAQPTPTPGGPPTPFPQYLAQTDADAVRIMSELAPNPGEDYASTGSETIANLTSVRWVRSTIQGINAYFPQISPEPQSGARAASTWNTPAWLFEFKGDVRPFNRIAPNGQGPLGHTLYMLLLPNEPGPLSIEAPPIDLSQLGTVNTINPGDSPGIDALRAPLTIAVGAPSLASGKVRMPVNATNPFNASLVPYTGINIHLRWNPAVFTFRALDTTGTVLPSPLCLTAISQDTDGGGVVIGCASLGGQTTATGLLATVVLTPAATGCSALHLFTYAKQDHGDTATGTYVVNAFSNQPLPVGYVDGSANVSGQAC